MKCDLPRSVEWMTGVLAALTATIFVAPPTRGAEPLWRQLMPRKKVEDSPSGDYRLTEQNGPWLIMASSFNGEAGESEARALVQELRERYNLPAYYHGMTFKVGDERVGRGIDDYGAPIRRRYQRGSQVLEYAVLVGEFPSIDDPDAQHLLERVKTIEPNALKTNGQNHTTQAMLADREFYKELKRRLGKTVPQGPMGHAFISRNPLLPKEYFTPGLDPEVAKWNGGEFSLLNCQGKYTIRVATFRGRTTLVNSSNFGEDVPKPRKAKDNDPLVVAGDNAHKLATALRARGWEAYEFHDRHESYVTVGSFDEMQDLGDGRLAPSTREAQIIVNVFGAATPNVGFEEPAYKELGMDAEDIRKVESDEQRILAQFAAKFQNGEATTGLHPKQFVGLPFDIQPQPMVAPKESIGASYARR